VHLSTVRLGRQDHRQEENFTRASHLSSCGEENFTRACICIPVPEWEEKFVLVTCEQVDHAAGMAEGVARAHWNPNDT